MLQDTPIECKNCPNQYEVIYVLEEIKEKIPKMASYESSDGQDLIMIADMLELINEYIRKGG